VVGKGLALKPFGAAMISGAAVDHDSDRFGLWLAADPLLLTSWEHQVHAIESVRTFREEDIRFLTVLILVIIVPRLHPAYGLTRMSTFSSFPIIPLMD